MLLAEAPADDEYREGDYGHKTNNQAMYETDKNDVFRPQSLACHNSCREHHRADDRPPYMARTGMGDKTHYRDTNDRDNAYDKRQPETGAIPVMRHAGILAFGLPACKVVGHQAKATHYREHYDSPNNGSDNSPEDKHVGSSFLE